MVCGCGSTQNGRVQLSVCLPLASETCMLEIQWQRFTQTFLSRMILPMSLSQLRCVCVCCLLCYLSVVVCVCVHVGHISVIYFILCCLVQEAQPFRPSTRGHVSAYVCLRSAEGTGGSHSLQVPQEDTS